MTGKELYTITAELGDELNIPLPAWEELSAQDRADWEAQAYENQLRDRPLPARLAELQERNPHEHS